MYLTARYAPHMFKQACPDIGDALRSLDDISGGNIEVLRHFFENTVVGRQFDNGRDRVADSRAVAGRKDRKSVV